MYKLIAAALLGAASVVSSPAASQARDWSKTVAATPQGGYLMGNPSARARLVEYGSLSCSHCATFDQTSLPRLMPAIRAGNVSYEFRNFILDPYDLAATLVARCGGSRTFFPVVHRVMGTQGAWKARVEAGQARIKALDGRPSKQVMPVIADIAGFKTIGASRGLAPAQMQQCLADEAAMERLLARTNEARAKGVRGTPTFFVNNQQVSDNSWDGIQAALRAAR